MRSNRSILIGATNSRQGGLAAASCAGFTLAEVLLASTITVMITLVAVSALKAVSDTSQVIEKTTETTSQVRFAARMMANDLANLYRDADFQNMEMVGSSQESDSSESSSLRFYAVERVKARFGMPEGDVYEVEYTLGPSKAAGSTLDAESTKRMLYRRVWPNPDKKKQPGGVLCPIAEGIDVFQTRFFDGKEWTTEWTQDARELPQLIEVTLAIMPEVQGRGRPTVQSFIMGFPRLVKGSTSMPGGQGSPDQSGGSQPGQGSPENSGQPGQPGQSGPSPESGGS